MRNKIFQQDAKIVSTSRVGKGRFKIIFKSSKIADFAKPGQFIEIMASCGYEPFLRRPFSIHRLRGTNIEILCEAVGRGTAILSQKKHGEHLDVIGPLGNGFDYRLPIILRQAQDASPKDTEQGRSADYRLPILIAGGMGVAPLIFLAERMAAGRRPPAAGQKPLVLIGAKTKKHLACDEEFRKLGCDVKIATDDGSRGFKGRVTDLLRKILPLAISHKPLAIYACGPKPMLKEIAAFSKQYKVPAQISLEEHMACGIGACLGCIVNTKSGFKRVCKEGPVFNADEIIWSNEDETYGAKRT